MASCAPFLQLHENAAMALGLSTRARISKSGRSGKSMRLLVLSCTPLLVLTSMVEMLSTSILGSKALTKGDSSVQNMCSWIFLRRDSCLKLPAPKLYKMLIE